MENYKYLEITLLVIGSLIIWYKDIIAIKLGIKKDRKSLETRTIENLQLNLNIYQEMIEDLDEKYQKRITEIQERFEYNIKQLQMEIDNLKEINTDLKKYIENQRTELKWYKEHFGDNKKMK